MEAQVDQSMRHRMLLREVILAYRYERDLEKLTTGNGQMRRCMMQCGTGNKGQVSVNLLSTP